MHNPRQITVQAITCPGWASHSSLGGCCPGTGKHEAAPELVQFTAPRVKINFVL